MEGGYDIERLPKLILDYISPWTRESGESEIQPKTWAVWFHLAMHEQLLAQQKAMEMQAQQMQLMNSQVVDNSKPINGKINVSTERKSPIAATTPLKTEFSPQTAMRQAPSA